MENKEEIEKWRWLSTFAIEKDQIFLQPKKGHYWKYENYKEKKINGMVVKD